MESFLLAVETGMWCIECGSVKHIRDRQTEDVYVGRRGHGEDGKWGNYSGTPASRTREAHSKQITEEYLPWLCGRIKNGKVTIEDLADLHGRDMVCFCVPLPCHGDVLRSAACWAVKRVSGQLQPTLRKETIT